MLSKPIGLQDQVSLIRFLQVNSIRPKNTDNEARGAGGGTSSSADLDV